MNILFSSVLCSNRLLDYIFKNAKIKPLYSVQKFSRLIAEGLVKNGATVDTMTSIPATRTTIDKTILIEKSETENGINYHYAPVINLPFIKNIIVSAYSFFFTLIWCIRNRKGAVICDILQVSTCIGSLLAAKLSRNQTITIITDIPGYSGMSEKSISKKIIMKYINSFDKYILLTEQMNELINTKRRPYIVMEGIVDHNMKTAQRQDNDKKILIYAGGLYEKYGIKMLIDAFMECKKDNLTELHLYGAGDMVDYIKECSKIDNNIIFHGSRPNDEIVEAELSAYLLINPRPSSEPLTKYSFPSKNMEYMVSGTPVVTTQLPGMPKEYDRYVYIFKDETTEGFRETLQQLFELPTDSLRQKGLEAQKFVLEKKNNIIQTTRIIQFIKL